MKLMAVLLVAQAGPFDDLVPKREALPPVPHTLLISDGKAMTRFEYKTGALCKRARDEVRRQAYEGGLRPGVVFYNPSMTAVCVPK